MSASGRQPEEMRFEGAGGISLVAQAWFPTGRPRATVLLSHGYAEHIGRYQPLIDALTTHNYAVFGLDPRGHDQSGGRRASIRHLDDFIDDLDLVARWGHDRFPNAPHFLLGHSMGGLIATRYTLIHGRYLDGLILSGPALQVGNNISGFTRRLSPFIARLLPDLPFLPPTPGILSRDPAVEDRFETDPQTDRGKMRVRLGQEIERATIDTLERALELKLPLLIMHGADDRLTDPEGSRQLIEQSSSPDTTLKIWPGVRHELFNEPDSPQVITYIIDWLNQHTTPTSS